MSRKYHNERVDKSIKDEEQEVKTYVKPRSSKSSNGKGNIRKPAKLNKGNRDNDPNWYFVSSEVADQAAQLSFQNVLGYGSVLGYTVPTIMRINTTMCPGNTSNLVKMGPRLAVDYTTTYDDSSTHVETGKAGVNLMAAKLYTTLSSFTGRTASYAPQDVAMMILAISAIAEWSEAIRRVFGLALTYNYYNRTMALGLIRSMGLEVSDFIANLSIYRMKFNVCMSRINQIPLLENITYIKKARDVYQRIYQDDPTNMSQIFYYMPSYTFKLDEQIDETGSVLVATMLNGAKPNPSLGSSTMGEWLDDLNEMITAVLESSTLNFIYADLLNMANKLKIQTWQFDYLAENYTVMPEFNANALLQMHNLTIHGFASEDLSKSQISAQGYESLANVWVTPGASIYCDADANNVVYSPVFDATGTGTLRLTNAIIDMPTDRPSIEDRIEALRYCSVASGIAVPNSVIGITQSGSCTVGDYLPDHYVNNVVLFNNIDYADNLVDCVSFAYSMTRNWTNNLLDFGVFEHQPIIKFGNTNTVTHILGTLQFFTTVDSSYIKRLLDVMYVGLFDFRI